MQSAMESCELDLDKVFEVSRFDYSQWMERSAADDGSASFNMLMSTYDIFYRHRNATSEDTGCIGTIFSDTRSFSSGYDKINSTAIVVPRFLHHVFDNVHGQNYNTVDAHSLAAQTARVTLYDDREEELANVIEEETTVNESHENNCENDGDMADNYTVEGGKARN
uniref:Uncharacterized protein n=1 Tax=Physcomitrium patens TaxID=3218 RepID=A0A7I3Z2P1_PHYPA